MRRIRSRFVLGLVVAVVLGVVGAPSALAEDPGLTIQPLVDLGPAQVDGGFTQGAGVSVVNYSTTTSYRVPLPPTTSSPEFVVEHPSNVSCGIDIIEVQPQGGCTIFLRFTPAALGTREATLTVPTDDPDHPLTTTVRGTGVPYDALQILADDPVAFPDTPLTGSSRQYVQLANRSGSSTTFGPISVPAPFVVAGLSCDLPGYTPQDPTRPATVPAGSSCTAVIEFRPVTVGPAGGTLTVATSSNQPPDTAQLTGTGIEPGPIPTITGVRPGTSVARGGTAVRVLGTKLDAVVNVRFVGPVRIFGCCQESDEYNRDASFSVEQGGTVLRLRTPSLRYQVPDGPGTILLETATGIVVSAPFTYQTPPPPTLTAITPSTGLERGGNEVRLTGTDLLSTRFVTFDGVSSDVRNAGESDTQLRVVVPPHAPGTVPVEVIAGNGRVSGSYTYTATPAPAITALTPATGPAGGNTAVRLTGTDLTGTTSVTVGGATVPFTLATNGRALSFRTPAHAAGTVPIVVTTPSGASAPASFTYTPTPAPVVTALSPTEGPARGNTAIRATGTDLVDVRSVTVGGASVPFTAATNGRSLTFRTPVHAAGAVPVVVTTPSGASAPTTFTYTPPPAPTVTALSPTEGPARGNTAVRLTGTDLAEATQVTVGGAAVPFTAATNGRTVTFRTPAHAAGTVAVAVTTPSGTSAPVTFSYR